METVLEKKANVPTKNQTWLTGMFADRDSAERAYN